jgi:parallel beta-helix repeat protein
MIYATADATLTGNDLSGNNHGIYIVSGNPVISNNTVRNASMDGMLLATAGTATVTGNTIASNSSNGISISAGNAFISGNAIHGNFYGIQITGGSPRILNSTISNNSYGVYAATSTGSDPVIHGSTLNCNYYYNLYSSTVTPINVTNNTWENAPPTIGDGQLGTCTIGNDICFYGPQPQYAPYQGAVPGTCFRPPA